MECGAMLGGRLLLRSSTTKNELIYIIAVFITSYYRLCVTVCALFSILFFIVCCDFIDVLIWRPIPPILQDGQASVWYYGCPPVYTQSFFAPLHFDWLWNSLSYTTWFTPHDLTGCYKVGSMTSGEGILLSSDLLTTKLWMSWRQHAHTAAQLLWLLLIIDEYDDPTYCITIILLIEWI